MKKASVLNSLSNAVRTLAMVREAGLEPARPEWTLEPESSESANSTTRAYRERSIIIASTAPLVKSFFFPIPIFPLHARSGMIYCSKQSTTEQELPHHA